MPVKSLIIYLLLFSSIGYGWLSQSPSNNRFQDQDKTKFSQQRALAHLHKIASAPRFAGSPNHDSVKDYLVDELAKLDLEVQVTHSISTSAKYYSSANVSNIVARLASSHPDANNKKALALVSHYDSIAYSSHGAGDAGSGIAVILEGLRSFIQTESQHENDIYVIFTDAEELGLLGAEAFVRNHPWAKNIGLVLNFEARGSGGISYMLLETNGGNSNLVEAFANADVSHPVGNSLMYSIYKKLPNDTDLSVFRGSGDIDGFNLAFIDDHFDYHTAQDTVQRLDLSSLNHQAAYITALLPYFANTDLTQLNSDTDHVYFNFADLALIHYPFSWVMPSCLLALLIFVVLLISGVKNKQLAIRNILLGFLPCGLSIIAAVCIGLYGWQALLLMYPQFADIPHGFPYTGHWILLAAILLSLFFSLAIYGFVLKKLSSINISELLIAPIAVWIFMSIAAALFLAGAGFVILVVSGMLAALATSLRIDFRHRIESDRSANSQNPLLYCIYALPGLVVLTPLIPSFTIGLGLNFLIISTVLTVLVALSLLAISLFVKGIKILSATLCFGLLYCCLQISNNADYSVDRQKPSNVNYLYDTQSERAYLFSYTKQLDSFTKQFFSSNDHGYQPIATLYPTANKRLASFVKPTEKLDVSHANYQALTKILENNDRYLELTVHPSRMLHGLQLVTTSPFEIKKMLVNGIDFQINNKNQSTGIVWRHTMTNSQPVTLELFYHASQTPKLRLIEFSYDLPDKLPNFVRRPEWIMPSPFRMSDAVIISQPVALKEK